MVDSDNGITNLHAPNKVIIDASMPVVVRDGGKMWSPEGKLEDTKAVIPDRCYSTIYQTVLEDCKVNGQFDPSTMGNVANVGLMAKKAEEYGSHDKTFEAVANGKIKVVDIATEETILEQVVEAGDKGVPVVVSHPESRCAKAFSEIVNKVLEAIGEDNRGDR